MKRPPRWIADVGVAPRTATEPSTWKRATVAQRDGSHVAFFQSDPDFGFGADAIGHVFLRDLGSDRTGWYRPVRRADAGRAAASSSTRSEASRRRSRPLRGQPGTHYLRDLVAGVTTPLEFRPARRLDLQPRPRRGTCAGVRVLVAEPVRTRAPRAADSKSTCAWSAPSAATAHMWDRNGRRRRAAVALGRPTTAPVITGLHVTQQRFRVRTKHGGTTFVFKVSERARVTISIAKRSKHRVTVALHAQGGEEGPQPRRVSRRTKHGRLGPGLTRHGASNGRRGQSLEGKDGDLHRGATLNSTVRAAGRRGQAAPSPRCPVRATRRSTGRGSRDRAAGSGRRRRRRREDARPRGLRAGPPRRGRRRRARPRRRAVARRHGVGQRREPGVDPIGRSACPRDAARQHSET